MSERARDQQAPAFPQASKPDGARVLPLRGLCPSPEKLTREDYRNLGMYTRLLIIEEDGAGIEELAAEFFGFDLGSNRDWAVRVTVSYLRRARWVIDQLYPWID
jgi:hypothetical protein